MKKSKSLKRKPKNSKNSKNNQTKLELFNTNNWFDSVTYSLNNLNNNKYFTGIMLIIINLGSKYVSLELSKTQEAYLKYTIGRQILIFSILWMGTRDILISLFFTAIFILLADYLLNENSKYCIIPEKYKNLEFVLDKNNDGIISEKEIDDAIYLLKKARKQKNKTDNNELYRENNFYIIMIIY